MLTWFRHRAKERHPQGERVEFLRRPATYIKYISQEPHYQRTVDYSGGYRYWIQTWGTPTLIRTFGFTLEAWQPTAAEWVWAPWEGEDLFRMYGQTYRSITQEQAQEYQAQPDPPYPDWTDEGLGRLWEYEANGGDGDVQSESQLLLRLNRESEKAKAERQRQKMERRKLRSQRWRPKGTDTL